MAAGCQDEAGMYPEASNDTDLNDVAGDLRVLRNQLFFTGRASKAFPIELSPAGQGPGNTARLRQTLARAPM